MRGYLGLRGRPLVARPSSHEWETPRELFDRLHTEFGFTIDGAALPANARLPRFWSPYEDGLLQPWRGERVFVNPPFGKEIARWVGKAVREQRRDCPLSALLVPVRSDTIWWHERVLPNAEIRFLKGRIRFERNGEPSDPAPFPCCVLLFWEVFELAAHG